MLIAEEKISKKATQKYAFILCTLFLFALIFFYLSISYPETHKLERESSLIIFPFFQIVFDFTFFLISIFLTCGALFYYSISDRDDYAIFGIIFLIIGIISIFYYLTINQKIIPMTDYSVFVPYFWWKSKIAICLAFIGGIFLTLIKKWLRIRRKQLMLAIFSAILFTTIFFEIYVSFFPKSLLLVYTSENLPSWELLPIGLYLLFAIPGMYVLYKKNPSYFFMGMILGFFLNIGSEVFFLFNPSLFFTNNLRMVQLVVIIAALPPLLGIFFDNFLYYNVIKKNFLKLARISEEKNAFVSSLTELLTIRVKEIGGYLHCLVTGVDGTLNIPQKVSLNRCYKGSIKVQSLIQELSELAFVESGKLLYDLELYELTFAIRTFLDEKISKKQPLTKVLAQFPDHPVYCLWDMRRGNQIIKNLIKIVDLAYPNMKYTFLLRDTDSEIFWECKTSEPSYPSIDKISILEAKEERDIEIYLLKIVTERLVKDQDGKLMFEKEMIFSLKLKKEVI